MNVFDWAYLDAEGNELGRSSPFEDCEAAEDWISISWPDLAANGVEDVVLFDHALDRHVYRMGLGGA
ncbi:MAG: hypothetical protein H0W82_00125 [Actinobacteria bacterium]|nr:hypothetical protein [Actinomycetota bacterium]